MLMVTVGGSRGSERGGDQLLYCSSICTDEFKSFSFGRSDQCSATYTVAARRSLPPCGASRGASSAKKKRNTKRINVSPPKFHRYILVAAVAQVK